MYVYTYMHVVEIKLEKHLRYFSRLLLSLKVKSLL